METEHLRLLHEEIEAIYLMDYKGLYQEDAALSMGVSRTTFSRIIKSARTKIATALINGKGIEIQDEKQEFCVAFICDDEKLFKNLSIRNQYLVFVKIAKNRIIDIETMLNPIYNTDQKPTHVLPEILSGKDVNYFIAGDAGEGFKNSLLTKGIFIIQKDYITEDKITTLLSDSLESK